jgi:hypothetical protein
VAGDTDLLQAATTGVRFHLPDSAREANDVDTGLQRRFRALRAAQPPSLADAPIWEERRGNPTRSRPLEPRSYRSPSSRKIGNANCKSRLLGIRVKAGDGTGDRTTGR